VSIVINVENLMLIKDLVKFANDLDASGLKKEADTIDVIIGAIKKLLEERGSGEGSDESGEGQKESGPEEKDGEEKQVELFGWKTTNFEICPGAVAAFSNLKEKLEDSPSNDAAEYALGAMKKTDDLFQIEKNAINSNSITSRELDDADKLFQEIIYNVGALSSEMDTELLSGFDFLGGHMDKIKSFKENKESDNE
jgi:hypothetical protein